MAETGAAPERLLDLLPPEGLRRLRERARRRTFAAGDRLLQQGETGDHLLLLTAGRVRISCVTREGRERVLDLRGPGELVGELAVIDGSPRSSSVTAIEPVDALEVSARDFRGLLDSVPGAAQALLLTLVARFRDADLKRVEFGASDTVGRVAARLLELGERYGEPRGGRVHVALPLTQEELAAWTGASRAGVAGALRTLRELGWIETGRREVVLVDPDALRARAS